MGRNNEEGSNIGADIRTDGQTDKHILLGQSHPVEQSQEEEKIENDKADKKRRRRRGPIAQMLVTKFSFLFSSWLCFQCQAVCYIGASKQARTDEKKCCNFRDSIACARRERRAFSSGFHWLYYIVYVYIYIAVYVCVRKSSWIASFSTAVADNDLCVDGKLFLSFFFVLSLTCFFKSEKTFGVENNGRRKSQSKINVWSGRFGKKTYKYKSERKKLLST